MAAPTGATGLLDAAAMFVRDEVAPHAARFDREGRFDDELVAKLARAGLLGAVVPNVYGGSAFDEATFGAVCAELGRACVATRSLVTVQNMVAVAIARWGTERQRERWLPRLADGTAVAAFCLTEPEVGTDASRVTTRIERDGGEWVVTGTKTWVTFGTLATVFLVIGTGEAGTIALLVDRSTAGVSVERIPHGLLGMRGAEIAVVTFAAARVPDEHVIGRVGAGFGVVATTALDHGRHSVAWGCVGIAESCLEHAAEYSLERHQFGAPLADHQLVRRLLSEMVVSVRAARALCVAAAAARDSHAASAPLETIAAKHLAARTAFAVASDTVSLHGARGCVDERPVERHLRDAKIMQIIEGTEEMNQLAICELALRRVGAAGAPAGTPEV